MFQNIIGIRRKLLKICAIKDAAFHRPTSTTVFHVTFSFFNKNAICHEYLGRYLGRFCTFILIL